MPRLQQLLARLLLLVAFLVPAALRQWLLLRPYREPRQRVRRALLQPRQALQQALRQILASNRQTEFGRTHAFEQIKDAEAYASRVPIRSYSELKPYFERQLAGEDGVLVSQPLLGFALARLGRIDPRPIPLTQAIVTQWQAAEAWLLDRAIARHPAVARGCALHILPASAPQQSAKGLPLAPLAVLMEAHRLAPESLPAAVPPALFAVPDEAARFYLVLRLALGQPVTLLRAASPGTLSILADQLEILGPRLVEQLAGGQVDHLEALPEALRSTLSPPANPALAQRLARRLATQGLLTPRDIWPELQLLVCATTGSARSAAERLADRFGNLPLLDPGYRTAEGILTWPWLEGEGGLLALGDQYLELMPPDSATPLPLEQLRVGQRVRPVLTSANGLYRYLLDDLLQVVQVAEQVPRLAVVGRAPFALRLETGELPEETVVEALVAAARSCEITVAGYTCWLEPPGSAPPVEAEQPTRGGWLDRLLRRKPPAGEPATLAAPVLTLALEPHQPLDPQTGRRLRDALERELCQRCGPYEQLRESKRLLPAGLLLLKAGTFARQSHRLLAQGAANGHAPPPPLGDERPLFAPEELESYVG